MTTLGFIGLGMMGDPMARNLAKAGHDIAVYDKRPEAMAKAVEAGARAADSVAVATEGDIVFIIVQTPDQVREVVDQITAGDSEKIVVVMSTVTPDLVTGLAEQYPALTFLDAPVSGAPILAELGALSIMVGGDREVYDRVLPYFQNMGQAVEHLGALGAGLSMKLVNNLLGLANAYILPEALKLGIKGGLDVAAMVRMIRAGSGSCWLVENWGMYMGLLGMVANDKPLRDNFNLIAEKDLMSVAAWANSQGQSSPIAESVLKIIRDGDVVDEALFEKLSKAKME